MDCWLNRLLSVREALLAGLRLSGKALYKSLEIWAEVLFVKDDTKTMNRNRENDRIAGDLELG
jgi:hypothetical protein